MTITIGHTPYGEISGEVVSFRNANRGTVRTENYFEWRYLSRPPVGGERLVVTARTGAGDLAGALSVIPHYYNFSGERRTMGKIADISVGERFRGQGLAARMFHHLDELAASGPYDHFIALPNTAAASALKKAGWKRVAGINRYVKVLRAGGFLGERGYARLGRTLSVVVDRAQERLFERHRLPAGATSGVVEELDESFDALWEEAGSRPCVIGYRDRAYLQWRFLDHPTVEHAVFALRDGKGLRGYVVFHNPSQGNWMIDDLLCADFSRDLGPLFTSFFSHLRKTDPGAAMAAVRLNENVLIGGNLFRYGFLRRDHQDFMIYPMPGGDAAEGKNWYLTAGDKDV